ncbi:MAG: hypothetical protein WAM60_11600 [Candidatus Promineifilaceae bacterium]
MNGEERLKQAIGRIRNRPSLVEGPVEAVVLTELRRIGRQVNGLEQMILARLYLMVERQFNESELQDLCFRLGVDYENLGGQGKAARVQSLVGYLHRRERIGELIEVCREMRPGLRE